MYVCRMHAFSQYQQTGRSSSEVGSLGGRGRVATLSFTFGGCESSSVGSRIRKWAPHADVSGEHRRQPGSGRLRLGAVRALQRRLRDLTRVSRTRLVAVQCICDGRDDTILNVQVDGSPQLPNTKQRQIRREKHLLSNFAHKSARLWAKIWLPRLWNAGGGGVRGGRALASDVARRCQGLP